MSDQAPLQSLPTRYQPTALRPEPESPRLPRSVAYGVAVEHQPGEFGMIDGPFADLGSALECVGREQGRILRFNPNQTETVLYAWSMSDQAWHLRSTVLQ